MFVTMILALALAIALMGISMHFMGDAFEKASKEADGADLLNKIEQIGTAATLFQLNHQNQPPDSLEALVVKDYLIEAPDLNGFTLDIGQDYVSLNGSISDEEQVTNGNMGRDFCMSINDNKHYLKCVPSNLIESNADISRMPKGSLNLAIYTMDEGTPISIIAE